MLSLLSFFLSYSSLLPRLWVQAVSNDPAKYHYKHVTLILINISKPGRPFSIRSPLTSLQPPVQSFSRLIIFPSAFAIQSYSICKTSFPLRCNLLNFRCTRLSISCFAFLPFPSCTSSAPTSPLSLSSWFLLSPSP